MSVAKFTSGIALGMLLFTLATPAKSEPAKAPLPPAETLLKKVVERAKDEDVNDLNFRNRYSFTRVRITEELNARGKVTKHEEKKGVNNPPPTPAVVSVPVVRTTLAAPAPAASGTRTNLQGKAFDKKDFMLDQDMINRFEFKVTGREMIDGRPALIMDFHPAHKKLPVKNFKDRFINKAAGRVWIDEGDSVLVKADLHLTESVNVVGGLVGAVKKFIYGFDRIRTRDGLWYTASVHWQLDGREVFSRKIMEYTERRQDVRKVERGS